MNEKIESKQTVDQALKTFEEAWEAYKEARKTLEEAQKAYKEAREAEREAKAEKMEEKRFIDGELLTLTELQGKLSGCPTKHILAKWAQAE